MKKLLFVLVVLTCLTGCTTRYTMSDAAPPVSAKLERGQPVYIALPQDGSFGDRVYTGSGLITASALQTALTPYSSTAIVGSAYEDQVTAIGSGKAKNARYVFVPDITNWVHRKAAWSGRASGVSVTMAVFDLTRPENEMRVILKDLRVQGRNMTFVSQHPGEILKPLLQQFVKEVY
ncbi:MAG: DUF4823 domain-containing protein [Desulfovibrio sp.]|jgi:hypothetical protein|nr:DUF4823 domain-containing protein [Desulfovibrio sp.]